MASLTRKQITRLVVAILVIGFLVASVASVMLDVANGTFTSPGWFVGWLQNLSTEMVGAFATFLLIELAVGRVREREAKEQEEADLKAKLIRQLGSQVNEEAKRAAEELRAHNWLEDGSLEGANLGWSNLQGAKLEKANLERAILWGANLQGAILWGANLQRVSLHDANLQEARLDGAELRGARLSGVNLRGATLRRASLQGARLHETYLQGAELTGANLQGSDLIGASLQGARLIGTNLQGVDMSEADLRGVDLFRANLQGTLKLDDEQLAQVNSLRDATMPDGSRYDGRFNLQGDIEAARKQGIDTDDPAAMAGFYGVSLEEYERGQDWARENLASLRGEAGEDDDEAEG